jgi:hypothetical protein
MIISFSLENFGPIKERQTLSFEAEKTTDLEDYYVAEPIRGLRLLKMALIYGPNASGKTTILNALQFLVDLMLLPLPKKTDKLDFAPFLFDIATPQQDSVLALDFVAGGVRYSYEVAFDQQAVTREVLYAYKPNKSLVFRRTTDMAKQLPIITFGAKIQIDKVAIKVLEANTL